MASISVDVDLDDFDLDEILDELEERYNSYRNQKKINDFIKKMKIDLEDERVIKTTILDVIKIDFFMNNIHKIKLSDLENLI